MRRVEWAKQRVDAGPLLVLIERRLADQNQILMGQSGRERDDHCLALFGVTYRCICRMRAEQTVTYRVADQVCCALGLHIDLIFDDFPMEESYV